ncbi:hypothetical protein [Streptomyces abyssomicinicus]|uniref:hypothetical protein n=1 Tax=Streptomyces abyssomicinicus TaxID=574929 RepID=UPI00124F7C04|nr:hypothetical protein [Streptomyces abyssomicinicus]
MEPGLLRASRGKEDGTDVAASLRRARRHRRAGLMRPCARVLGDSLHEVILGLLVQAWKPDAQA